MVVVVVVVIAVSFGSRRGGQLLKGHARGGTVTLVRVRCYWHVGNVPNTVASPSPSSTRRCGNVPSQA